MMGSEKSAPPFASPEMPERSPGATSGPAAGVSGMTALGAPDAVALEPMSKIAGAVAAAMRPDGKAPGASASAAIRPIVGTASDPKSRTQSPNPFSAMSSSARSPSGTSPHPASFAISVLRSHRAPSRRKHHAGPRSRETGPPGIRVGRNGVGREGRSLPGPGEFAFQSIDGQICAPVADSGVLAEDGASSIRPRPHRRNVRLVIEPVDDFDLGRAAGLPQSDEIDGRAHDRAAIDLEIDSLAPVEQGLEQLGEFREGRVIGEIIGIGPDYPIYFLLRWRRRCPDGQIHPHRVVVISARDYDRSNIGKESALQSVFSASWPVRPERSVHRRQAGTAPATRLSWAQQRSEAVDEISQVRAGMARSLTDEPPNLRQNSRLVVEEAMRNPVPPAPR